MIILSAATLVLSVIGGFQGARIVAAGIGDARSKQVQTRIIQMREAKVITDKQIRAAAQIAINCRSEIVNAMRAIEKEDLYKALDHTINAKRYLAELRRLRIPIQEEQKNLETVRRLLYQARSRKRKEEEFI